MKIQNLILLRKGKGYEQINVGPYIYPECCMYSRIELEEAI